METKIKNTKRKHIRNLYTHLSVQSLLDLKAMTGRIERDDLIAMLLQSKYSYSFIVDDLTRAIIFIIPNEKKEYNVYMYSTEFDLDIFEKDMKAIFDDMKDEKFSSIIYNGSKKNIKILKKCGFSENSVIKYGIEKKKFLLLRR